MLLELRETRLTYAIIGERHLNSLQSMNNPLMETICVVKV